MNKYNFSDILSELKNKIDIEDIFIGSYKAYVHSIFPNLFITSSTDLVKNLDNKMKNAGCKKINNFNL